MFTEEELRAAGEIKPVIKRHVLYRKITDKLTPEQRAEARAVIEDRIEKRKKLRAKQKQVSIERKKKAKEAKEVALFMKKKRLEEPAKPKEPSPLIGRKMSPEAVENLRKAATGRKYSPEVIAARVATRKINFLAKKKKLQEQELCNKMTNEQNNS